MGVGRRTKLFLPDLVCEVCSDAGARGPDGVTERDGPSVHVQLGHVQSQLLGYGQSLRGEGLVHLGFTRMG